MTELELARHALDPSKSKMLRDPLEERYSDPEKQPKVGDTLRFLNEKADENLELSKEVTKYIAFRKMEKSREEQMKSRIEQAVTLLNSDAEEPGTVGLTDVRQLLDGTSAPKLQSGTQSRQGTAGELPGDTSGLTKGRGNDSTVDATMLAAQSATAKPAKDTKDKDKKDSKLDKEKKDAKDKKDTKDKKETKDVKEKKDVKEAKDAKETKEKKDKDAKTDKKDKDAKPDKKEDKKKDEKKTDKKKA